MISRRRTLSSGIYQKCTIIVFFCLHIPHCRECYWPYEWFELLEVIPNWWGQPVSCGCQLQRQTRQWDRIWSNFEWLIRIVWLANESGNIRRCHLDKCHLRETIRPMLEYSFCDEDNKSKFFSMFLLERTNLVYLALLKSTCNIFEFTNESSDSWMSNKVSVKQCSIMSASVVAFRRKLWSWNVTRRIESSP